MTTPITGQNQSRQVSGKDKDPSPATTGNQCGGNGGYAAPDECISDAPKDFAGHRGPDFDGDGHITDAESRAFETASSERKHAASLEADKETARMREDSRNYRAEVAATAEMAQNRSGGKSHGVFGKGGGGNKVLPLPPPPDLGPRVERGTIAGDF